MAAAARRKHLKGIKRHLAKAWRRRIAIISKRHHGGAGESLIGGSSA